MVIDKVLLPDTSRAGDKFETISTSNGYSKYMKLKIRNVGPSDFGNYRCVAKNSLGETDGLIKLDGTLAYYLKGHFRCSHFPIFVRGLCRDSGAHNG